MKYSNIIPAKFISRQNRFIATIEIDNTLHICHVKNTGRLQELLIPNCNCYVQCHNDPKRKTNYSLICVEKDNSIINIDSQCPNKLFFESCPIKCDSIKPEFPYKDSRFDFLLTKDNQKIFVEVKGVTLIEDRIAMFPDAPSTRAIKHINHLIEIKKSGNQSYIVFIIKSLNVDSFKPNPKDLEFSSALTNAKLNGVEILAFGCKVFKDSIFLDKSIDVIF